jgi:hypothetical protein
MFSSMPFRTSATSSVMSRTAPDTTREGSPRYSTCTMSGVSSARSAARSLEEVSCVPPTSESLMLMPGCSSSYRSMIAWAAGSAALRLQVQNSSVTDSDESSDAPPQPARAVVAPARARAISARARRERPMDLRVRGAGTGAHLL